MSTRANIGIYENGKVTAVYNHSDGMPERLGKILLTSFNTADEARNLISRGGVSVICSKESVERNAEISRDKKYKERFTDMGNGYFARFYNDNSFMTFSNPASYYNGVESDIEYAYLFNNGTWECYFVNAGCVL